MSTFIPKVGDKVKFIGDEAPKPKYLTKGKEYEVFAGYNHGSVVLYIVTDNDKQLWFDELFCEWWELV